MCAVPVGSRGAERNKQILRMCGRAKLELGSERDHGAHMHCGKRVHTAAVCQIAIVSVVMQRRALQPSALRFVLEV